MPRDASVPPQEPQQRVHLHGRWSSVNIEGLAGLDLHLLVHQSVGRRAHEDGPEGRPVLEARGQGGGVTDRRVELLQGISQVADDYQPRVESHADSETSPWRVRVQCRI
jgi:hypothetical protein